jgi:ABC-2 type transport system permease protein
MKKTLIVVRHELTTTLGRPWFLVVAFGVPLLAIVVFAAVTVVRGHSSSSGGVTPTPEAFQLETEGYVDHSGLITAIPQDIPPGHLLAYADEQQAQRAMASGQISAYYVIPEDYVDRGELFYVYPDTTPLASGRQEWLILRTVLHNMLGGDGELADLVWNPVDLQLTGLAPELQHGTSTGEDCSRPGFGCESNPIVRYLPAFMVVLFYASFMINANLLTESVGSEKENQTIEVLIMALTPRQMLAGKIIGLGIAALLHTIAWLGCAFILLRLGGQTLSLPQEFTFPVSILVWGLLFFLLGFAIYASLMAGVGALVSRLKETTQASGLILMPLIVGYLVGFIAPMADASQSPLPIALSLFPLTAPVVMIMRLTDGDVPTWQLLLSVGLMAVTAYVTLRAVAALFHAQNLLSGQPFSLKRYLRALVGRT